LHGVATPTGKRKRQLYVLQGLPGIGPERATRLLDTFGSLEEVFGAEDDDLAEVDGVGTKTAERIHHLVSEASIPYGRR